MTEISGHGGAHAVAVAREYGVDVMFTLSGGHVFPLYDAAVHMDPPMRLLDVRHEQTAVFAAEATARLTRAPGLAVLTAWPGVTNGVSAVTTAYFNGSPVVVLAGVLAVVIATPLRRKKIESAFRINLYAFSVERDVLRVSGARSASSVWRVR